MEVGSDRVKGRMSEETEGVESIVNGDNDYVGRLLDPVIKRPVGGVAIDVACGRQVC